MNSKEKIEESVEYILQNKIKKCDLGIIVGTGLGGLVNSVNIIVEIQYSSIPHFPLSKMEMQNSRIIFGKINSREILIFDGRFHKYEDLNYFQITYPVFIMSQLGVKKLVVTNAAGGIDLKLKKAILKNKIVFALTHNYSSYPMLREAKNIISNQKLGKINLINVEYPQGYTVGVKKKDEKATLKWRLDKKQSGPSMILSEIGTHAYHLLRYVTGLEANEISAEVNSLSSEISVDDNAFVLLRMRNKARGIIWVSSAATGGENGLKIRVYGTKGSIEWLQDDPNNLKFTELDKPMKVITRASKLVSKFSLSSSRIAAGHPEGFFEAFANIYSEFADQIHNKNKKYSFPTIDDGVAGIKFIYAAKKSSNLNSKWIKI